MQTTPSKRLLDDLRETLGGTGSGVRYPHTPIGELALLPTNRRNPGGRKPSAAVRLAFQHRPG